MSEPLLPEQNDPQRNPEANDALPSIEPNKRKARLKLADMLAITFIVFLLGALLLPTVQHGHGEGATLSGKQMRQQRAAEVEAAARNDEAATTQPAQH